MGRELKNSLAECLWLWVFHKVAVKESAGAAVVSRWEEEGIHFQGQTPGCWQAFSSCWLVTEDFSSLPHGLFFFFGPFRAALMAYGSSQARAELDL